MPSDLVTIVWAEDDLAAVSDGIATDAEVEVVRVVVGNEAGAIKEARVRGGVVVVANSDDAERFLAAGADEVIDVTGASAAAIGNVVRRARTRAAARLDAPIDVALSEVAHDGEGLALLTGALVRNMGTRLAGALDACGRLEGLAQGVVQSARAGSPDEAPSDWFPEELAITGSSAIRDLAVGVARDVRATVEVVQRILTLTGPATAGMCDISKVAFEVVGLVQRQVTRAADVALDVPDSACVIPMGHGSAMQMIASLLRNALENTGRAARKRGRIDVRVTIEDDLVVLEVSDNGARIDPDVRRRALEGDPAPLAAGTHGLSLLLAANQIRRASGEVLIDSSADLGTSVRVFFPASATTVHAGSVRKSTPS